MGVYFKIRDNRDLEILLDDEKLDEGEIEDLIERCRGSLWDLMEYQIGNGGPYPTDPEEQYRDGYCNLTDAPMIVTGREIPDSGHVGFWGSIWWFPGYCLEDPVETLLKTGKVVFTFGYEIGKPKDCEACRRAPIETDGQPTGQAPDGTDCPACNGRGFTLVDYASPEEWFAIERSVFH